MSLLVAALFATCLSATEVSAATPKPGAKCVYFGQSVTTSNKKFRCVMVGNKLVWNKGAVMSTFTPLAPRIAIPITFDNLLSRADEIPGVAYANVQDVIATNQTLKAPSRTFKFSIAPGLTSDPAFYEAFINKERIFFAHVYQPESYIGILYSAKDMDWARTKFDELTGFQNRDYVVRAPFGGDPNSTGGGANSSVNMKVGFTVFGHYSGYESDPFVTNGSMTAHEYVHQVQATQFSAPYGDQSSANSYMPCWMTEGQANFNGISVVAKDLNEYLQVRSIQAHSLTLRNAQATGQMTQLNKFQLTPDYILSYYQAMNQAGENRCISSSQYGLGYSLGMLTIEALSAIKGSESSMALVQKLANGRTFDEAFFDIYGARWSDASTTLAKLVSGELQSILS